MLNFRKHNNNFKGMAIFVLLAFASTAFSAGLQTGRIIPKGKVALYHGNQKIGEFSSEAPLPEGTFLSVENECGVKMKGLYLLGIDKSLFSVTTNTGSRELRVKHGTVYFALSTMPHILVFITPDGVITTYEVMLNASVNDGLLSGYISVTDHVTKLGVLKGGSMLVSVDGGETKRVKAGQELRLAQADLFEEVDEEGDKADTGPEPTTTAPTEGVSAKYITIGVASVVALVGGIVSLSGGDDKTPASPASP